VEVVGKAEERKVLRKIRLEKGASRAKTFISCQVKDKEPGEVGSRIGEPENQELGLKICLGEISTPCRRSPEHWVCPSSSCRRLFSFSILCVPLRWCRPYSGKESGCLPIILDNQEAEIRRIVVQGK
jgi:hypothetical protein